MLIEGIGMGLLIGKIRGGKISNLRLLSIRAWPLILISFTLQLALVFSSKIHFLLKYGGFIYDISLLLLVVLLVMNTSKKWIWVILIGVIMNLMVISFNGGKMPISIESLSLAGKYATIEGIKSGEILRYVPLNEAQGITKLLAKYIVIPKPYLLSKVMSVGDLLVSLGFVLFIQGEMIRNRFASNSLKMIKIPYRGK
ncbi:DUF5317 domain-containing protein [Marinisporobacter balticus]|uniref:DUF5317 domain-containing protein n=1 Tax=Marinisporobacter balticus TaxID=2018667 RepID=A0A4R2KRQ3_9FIRM|nr:DUF5317 domain-containing protein [Marinisporobacter balticus]TCO76443.1 hypothetical protein EV214_10845 [Marinisporobacter balticus]